MGAMTNAAGEIWVERRQLAGVADAPLQGLHFAVKDNIAVAGLPQGCGNPFWRSRQPPQPVHATVVEQLLQAGACCKGITWMDEFAFGLSGENPWGGSPPNLHLPGAIVGGSSSGSAAAVAGGLVDVALGTDTGGSIRVPASWNGLLGWRPSHGLISTEGVFPLAPSLDVVGLLARSLPVLRAAAQALLKDWPAPRAPERLLVIPELWPLLDASVHQLLQGEIRSLASHHNLRIEILPLSALQVTGTDQLLQMFCAIQWHEIADSLAVIPDALPVGATLQANRRLVANRDRSRHPWALAKRGLFTAALHQALCDAWLCVPVTPCIAPRVGQLGVDRFSSNTIPRCLSLNAIAGLSGCPELVLPLSFEEGPVGLGLVAAAGQDGCLLQEGLMPPEQR
jgi:amidase